MTRQWRKGPPPEIGWWPASVTQDPESIRWWNGAAWSAPAIPDNNAEDAAYFSSLEQSPYVTQFVQWTDRWWL